MPRQSLTGNSSLLTPHGWLSLNHMANSESVVGVDRAGRLSEGSIQVAPASVLDKVAYIGSNEAFGQFHPTSVLIDSDGRSRTALEIVEDNLIGEWQFENVLSYEPCRPTDATIANLWTDLQKCSVLASDDRLVVPARGGSNSVSARFPLIADNRLRNPEAPTLSYALVEKEVLRNAMMESWPDTVAEIVATLFEKTDEGPVAIDRGMSLLCLWQQLAQAYLGAREAQLEYDSLQHTTAIFMNFERVRPASGFSKGGTAFLRNQREQSYRIAWDDPSWCPVSSGFILASA